MRTVLLCSALALALAACTADHPGTSPCDAVTCTTPPAPSCSDATTLVTAGAGTCRDSGSSTGECVYDTSVTDCGKTGQVCANGACVAPTDPCAGTACNQPPAPTCDQGVLTGYAAAGTCTSPGGTASCAYARTTTDCGAMDKVCSTAGAGACVDPCATNPCTTPPADTCASDTLEHHASPGTCTSPGGAVACAYPATPVDCTATDQICAAGGAGGAACADPCVGFACTSPPADTCTDNTLTSYPATGTCTSPAGVPGCGYAPTTTDCTAIDRICQGGACVDPCVGVTCTAPPAPTCTGAGNTVARSFAATGTCASPGGVPGCVYAPDDHDCALSGQGCTDGACTGPVLFVRLQFPTSITDVAGAQATVYGRIFVTGVTDQTGGNDANPDVVVQVGVGSGADPTTWTWTAAAPNPSYGPGSPGYEANNDEYQATLTVPAVAPTTLHVGFRLSNDGGATWIYGDAGNAGSSDGFTTPGDLDVAAPYFSEYVEGSSSNKAIEIFNPGSIGVALAGCFVDIYANGNTSKTSIPLTAAAVIAPGDVFVLCHNSYGLADAAACDQKSGSVSWNGNDAVALRCASGTLDVLGQIGHNPGTEWGTGLTSTADNTLLRVCTVTSGDLDGNDAFDPGAQWQGYAVDTSHLGARNCPLP